MKKTKYKYNSAEGFRVGKMVCRVCGKEITSGEFRYRELNHKFEFLGYVEHEHKSCASKNDLGWSRVDAAKSHQLEKEKSRLEAYRSFAEKWGTDALDGEIEDMENLLSNVKVWHGVRHERNCPQLPC